MRAFAQPVQAVLRLILRAKGGLPQKRAPEEPRGNECDG